MTKTARYLVCALVLFGCSETSNPPPAPDLARDSGPRKEAGRDAPLPDRPPLDLAKPDLAVPCGDGQLGILCGGVCVSPTTDPKNCGSCGKACAGGEACVGGTCQSSCTGGTSFCSGTCVNLAT